MMQHLMCAARYTAGSLALVVLLHLLLLSDKVRADNAVIYALGVITGLTIAVFICGFAISKIEQKGKQ